MDGGQDDAISWTPSHLQPRTTGARAAERKYPYLLSTSEIDSPDQVWAIDITCIPWRRGHVYLTAIIDWHTRYWHGGVEHDGGVLPGGAQRGRSSNPEGLRILSNTDQGQPMRG
ncbi:MAG: hypothetical protein R3F19_18690 [Verrucomicrobiales bacterium]